MTFEFYGYIIVGFCIGAYLHSNRIHHAIHWLIIKTLESFVWMLKKTDPHYRKPNTKPAKFTPTNTKQEGIEVSDEELSGWLSKNPHISVQRR